MRVVILTLSWNGLDKLKRLRSGLNANLAKLVMSDGKLKEGFECPQWLVRDNGSKDDTVKELNNWAYLSDSPFAPTVYDYSHNRDNFAQGMNDLADKANLNDDDLILLLNNDVVFNDDKSLLSMYNLIKRAEIGVVGTKLNYLNKSSRRNNLNNKIN